MESEICSFNFAAYDDSGFTYGEVITEAVSTINGGNGVDIDEISEYIKERYEVPVKFRKQLRDKLKKLVSGNKLDKVENRYKILNSAATTQVTNPTQTLNSEDSSTKSQDLPSTSIVSEDFLEKLRDQLKKFADNYDYKIKSGETVVIEAVSTINGGNIYEIFEYIKEKYGPQENFWKRLKDGLKKLVSENKLHKVGNRYKIPDADATTEATNPVKLLNPKDFTKPQDQLSSTSMVSDDLLEKLRDQLEKISADDDYGCKCGEAMVIEAVSTVNDGKGADIDEISEYIKEMFAVPEKLRRQLMRDGLKKLVSLKKLDKVGNRYKIPNATAITTEATNPTQLLNPEDSTKSQDLPSSTSMAENNYKILDGATTTEATNPTQILNLPSSTIVPEDLRKGFIDGLAKTVALAENLEFDGKIFLVAADKLDRFSELNHNNVLLAKEIYKQCKEGKPIPLVMFNQDVVDHWLVG